MLKSLTKLFSKKKEMPDNFVSVRDFVLAMSYAKLINMKKLVDNYSMEENCSEESKRKFCEEIKIMIGDPEHYKEKK